MINYKRLKVGKQLVAVRVSRFTPGWRGGGRLSPTFPRWSHEDNRWSEILCRTPCSEMLPLVSRFEARLLCRRTCSS